MMIINLFFLSISFLSHTTPILAIETTTIKSPASSSMDSTLAPPLPSTAEKLTRLRRQPPYAIIKHYIRTVKPSKQRRRIKRPKIKYGPPKYSYIAPITYYKPMKSLSQRHYPNTFHEFQNIKFDTSDLELPPSSYEAQTMDLDFYNDGGKQAKAPRIEYSFTSENESPPSYSYSGHSSTGTRAPHQKYGIPKDFEYASDFKDFDSPHPTFESDKDFGGTQYSTGSDHSYAEPPENSFESAPSFDNSYHNQPSYDVPENPSNKYEIENAPSPIEQSYEPPSKDYGSQSGKHSFGEPPSPPKTDIEITYSPSYEINLPPSSSDNTYKEKPGHFAEPPVYTPPDKTSSYQPESPPSYQHEDSSSSYNPPSGPGHQTHNAPAYQPPSSPAHQSPAEPVYQSPSAPGHQPPSSPAYQPPSAPEHKQPRNPNNYRPSSSGPEYQPPSESGYHPPSSSGHQPPSSSGYQPPSGPGNHRPPSSPAYQPPSAPGHQPPSASGHPPKNHFAKPPPTGQPSHPNQQFTSETSNLQSFFDHDDVPSSQELPLTPNYKRPSYDFPKSSYEVPIYDPIPFDASNREQEFYPPQPYDDASVENIDSTDEKKSTPNHKKPDTNDSAEELDVDTRSSSTSKRPKYSRERKVTRGRGGGNSTVAPIKHILDVPELEMAFEAGKRKTLKRYNSEEPDTNESSKMHNYIPSTMKTILSTENFFSNSWNPLRIRTSSRIVPPVQQQQQPQSTVSTTTTRFKPSTGGYSTSYNQRSRQRQRDREKSLYTTPNVGRTRDAVGSMKHVDILSIEKSQSHSYYDGTLAPPTPKPMTTTYRNSPTRFKMPTKLMSQSLPTKRTTKSIFDTTHFKSPIFQTTQHDKDDISKLLGLGQNLPKNHKLY